MASEGHERGAVSYDLPLQKSLQIYWQQRLYPPLREERRLAVKESIWRLLKAKPGSGRSEGRVSYQRLLRMRKTSPRLWQGTFG